jgi:hypothetical protein
MHVVQLLTLNLKDDAGRAKVTGLVAPQHSFMTSSSQILGIR